MIQLPRPVLQVITIVLLLISAVSFSQSAAEWNDPSSVRATKISFGDKIILDGHLNEEVWSKAQTISDFLQVNPDEGARAKFDTEVKIVYGEKNLYIGAFLKDVGKEGIRVLNLKRDFDLEKNDLFGIAIDPFNDRRNAVAFQVTPYGTQRDLQVVNGIIKDVDWDALWRAKTRITDKGWYAELAIPFNSLKYPVAREKNKLATWRINFLRIHRRSNEISSFPGYPRSQNPYRMNHAMNLHGIRLKNSGNDFRINPYFLQQLENNDKEQLSWNTKIGGDFQWALSPNANVDLTFNTDFALADIDKEVINLSRFSIYLPEKREFFLEGAGLFVTGDQHVKPFFSRRIGLERNNGNPVPIIGGVKFLSRSTQRNLGALYVLQDASASANRTHYAVLRLKENLNIHSDLGFLITSKYEEGKHQNHVFTTDGTHRFNQKWRLSYMWSNSFRIRNQVNEIGSAANTQLSYLSDKFVFRSNHTLISRQYKPETGFISSNNIIDHSAFGYPVFRKKWLPSFVRAYKPGVGFNITQRTHDLKFQTGAFNVSPVYLSFNNGGLIVLNYKRYWQTLTSRFEVLHFLVDPGTYSYNRFKAYFSSDPSREFSVSTSYEWGGFYNGRLTKVKAGFTYAPIPNIFLEGNYEFNKIEGLKRMTPGNSDSHLFSSSLHLALSPDLQLNTFYQYNNTYDRNHLYTRISWQFAPLSFIHLIYNINKHSPGMKERAILKINLMKNF